MAADGVDAYFGVRREHMRWLTGFNLADGEEKVAGHSGQFLVGTDRMTLVTDSRYTVQAGARPRTRRRRDRLRPARGAGRACVAAVRGAPGGGGGLGRLPRPVGSGWPPLPRTWSSSRWMAGSRRCGPRRRRTRSSASPRPAPWPTGRSRPSCRRSGAGVTEHDLALRLEWLIRTGGAEALAFDVACLAGPEAALPHGSPGDRPVLDGAVLLFDFGAQVEGYRSDMTRTLFVGEPRGRGTSRCTTSSRRAQQAAIEAHRGAGSAAAHGAQRPGARCRGPRRHRRRRGPGRPTATASGTGSASPRTRSPACRGRRPRRRCPAPPCSRWSPGSTSRARPASGSRTSSTSTRRVAWSSG